MTEINDTLLAAVLESLDSGELFDRPVIITELDPSDVTAFEAVTDPYKGRLYVAPDGRPLLLQALYTPEDRAALARRVRQVTLQEPSR